MTRLEVVPNDADGSMPARLALPWGRVLEQRVGERSCVGAAVGRADDPAVDGPTIDAGEFQGVDVVEQLLGGRVDLRGRRGAMEREDRAGHDDEHGQHHGDQCTRAHPAEYPLGCNR
jgi:hypothetical protein